MSNERKSIKNKNNETSNTKWQQLMVGAGSTAAVISEDSMKCLKYCVSWLLYATRHISQQMDLLKSFLVSLATHKQPSATVLDSIKKDMVLTLKKVVDVITCYASNSLPYQAKMTIRGNILNLPNRWASLNEVTQQQIKNDPSYKQEEVALKLLAFGQESNEMLNSIHQVFDHTIQQAERWLKSINDISLSIPLIHGSLKSNIEKKEDITLPPIHNLHLS